QGQQLGMAQLHPAAPDPRPAERRFLQPLGVKAQPGAIPPNDLDPICPPGAEHIERAVEGIGAGVAHQANQAVRTLPEVHGLAGQEYLHTRGDHAERTARRTRRRCSSLTMGPTRTRAPTMPISMTPPEVPASSRSEEHT